MLYQVNYHIEVGNEISAANFVLIIFLSFYSLKNLNEVNVGVSRAQLTSKSNNSTQLVTCWVLNRVLHMRDVGTRAEA